MTTSTRPPDTRTSTVTTGIEMGNALYHVTERNVDIPGGIYVVYYA
jgi:hypothetical protein